MAPPTALATLLARNARDLMSCIEPDSALCPSPLALVLALAAPHFLYAFVWLAPGAWQRVFGKRSVDVFASAGVVGKAIQFTAVLLWFACNRADGGGGLCVLGSFAPPLSLAAWLAALVLGGYGQALNVGIFRAIGRDGVYYGTRLGKRIPWVKGWPFDAALAHPQYVGSAMTVWAGALLMGGARPAGTAVLVTYWTLLYVVTALMEQYL